MLFRGLVINLSDKIIMFYESSIFCTLTLITVLIKLDIQGIIKNESLDFF